MRIYIYIYIYIERERDMLIELSKGPARELFQEIRGVDSNKKHRRPHPANRPRAFYICIYECNKKTFMQQKTYMQQKT